MNTTKAIPNPTFSIIRGLAWDVGLPVAAYYVLRAFGATEWAALLGASGVAAVRIVWSAARERKLNQFALLMLLVYGLGFLLSFVTGDPRIMLLKGSVTTAAVGVVFLATAVRGKQPLSLSALQSFMPTRAQEFADMYRDIPEARHGFRLSSTVWGVGLLAEAVLRIPVIYVLPVDVAVGASTAMFVATFVLLSVWNGWYTHRAFSRSAD